MPQRRTHRSTGSQKYEVNKSKNMTYYDVLGVTSNASLSEIKKNFRIMARTYHPDHVETGDATIFALVARAYECLSDENKRSEYDRMLSIEKKAQKTDFLNTKKAFEEFLKAQEQDVTNKGIEHAKSRFKIEFEDIDRKRGLDRSKLDEDAISPEDANRRMRDMEMAREQDEIEFSQPKVFDPLNYNKDEWNRVFEEKYKHGKDDQLVKRNGAPSAFNESAESSYISCEGNYDDIFEENNVSGNSLYGTQNDIGNKFSVTREDLERAKGQKSSFSTHNKITDTDKVDFEKRMRERELEDKMFDARKMKDFDTDNKMGGYGFLHQVGLTGRELEWDHEEIDEHAMIKLIELRSRERKNEDHDNIVLPTKRRTKQH